MNESPQPELPTRLVSDPTPSTLFTCWTLIRGAAEGRSDQLGVVGVRDEPPVRAFLYGALMGGC